MIEPQNGKRGKEAFSRLLSAVGGAKKPFENDFIDIISSFRRFYSIFRPEMGVF